MPNAVGGLGLRSMVDINYALLTKLDWNVCVIQDKPCAQLMKARYLRGKNLLEANRHTDTASWLWGGI